MAYERIKIIDDVTLDSEADCEAAYTCTSKDIAALCNYNRYLIVLQMGTETGSANVQFTDLQASYDSGSTWETVKTSLGASFTAAGTTVIVGDGTFGLPDQLKFLVTVTTLNGSNYFANCRCELHVGYDG